MINNRDATFAPYVWYDVGDGPYDLVTGDFDRDGDIDIATANAFSSDVSILSNNGTGTFAADVVYGAGTYPKSIAAGDLDRDGDLDLVTANRDSNNWSMLLNNGNGTFAAHVVNQAGNGPDDLALGDLNGDARLDVVVLNAGSANVAVSLNGGVVSPPPPATITLSATGRVSKNKRFVDLSWSGATSSKVDIYRDGSKITTTANDGAHTDQVQKAGTYKYKVCQAGTSTCSNEATVKF